MISSDATVRLAQEEGEWLQVISVFVEHAGK